MAVAKYLSEHLDHPTADEIYSGLRESYPTLSRTTVYNTVKLLAENGCVALLGVESQGVRYDFDTSPHAHFTCTACGRIIDVPLGEIPQAPREFKVESMQLSYRGVCPDCQAVE